MGLGSRLMLSQVSLLWEKKEKDLGKKEKGKGREGEREEEREEEGEGGKGGEEEREKCVWRNREPVLLEENNDAQRKIQ